MMLSGTSSSDSEAYMQNDLRGVDEQTTIAGSIYADKYIYTLAAEGGALGLYKYYGPDDTDNTTLAARNAFLPLDAATSARGLVFKLEDVTGISTMQSAEFRVIIPWMVASSAASPPRPDSTS